MFYSQVILARKGPLGKIWLAAHFDKKLTKNQIFTTDISESVDSVLNPPAPLALRVSGHLMLGIVRIYSRKVKYLMADCTEAMWKIKLAFRPGNVDLADAQSATAVIDDPRFFGKIMPDQDYPELEDIAFSQNMLSNFVSLQAARGRTLASQQDTTQDENDYRNMSISESPMMNRKRQTPLSERDMNRNLLDMGHIPGEESWKGKEGRDSNDSRMSNIEMLRGELRADRSISGDRDRASLSTLRSSISTGGGLAMRFDDDIPAFDENIEDFGGDQAPPMSYFNEYNQEEMMPEMDNMENMDNTGYGDNMRDEDYLGGEMGDIREDNMQNEQNEDPNMPEGEYKSGSPTQDAPDRVRKVQRKKAVQKRGKRQKVAVDESVELSSRAIKLRMSDMAPIMRRKPGDYLPKMVKRTASSSYGQSQGQGQGVLALRNSSAPVPPGARGLCPELQSLFAMTMTPSDRLPFPRRLGLAAGDRQGAQSVDRRDRGDRESLSIENVRDGSVPGSDARSRRVSSLLLEGEQGEEGEEDRRGRFSLQGERDFGEEGAFDPLEGQYNDNMGEMGEMGEVDNLGDNFGQEYDQADQGEGQDQEYGGEYDGMYGAGKYGSEEDLGPGALKAREESLRRRNQGEGYEGEGEREGYEEGVRGVGGSGKNGREGRARRDDFSVRTAMVRDVLKEQLKGSESVSFSDISRGISRRTAAACFLEVLQLKTWGYIDCAQAKPFADISIQATDKLWAGENEVGQLIQA